MLTIHHLPYEKLLDVFSHMDIDTLLNSKGTSLLWKNLGNEIFVWQNLIRKYFPQAAEDNKSDFELCPQLLFRKKYQYFRDRLQNLTDFFEIKPYLLPVLAGNLAVLDHEDCPLSPTHKKVLWQCATANGNTEALLKISQQQLEDICEDYARTLPALHLRASNNTQEESVLEDPRDFEDFYTVKLFCGNTSGLLELASYEHALTAVLLNIASLGNLRTFKLFMSAAKHLMPDTLIGSALSIAAENGHYEIAEEILNHHAHAMTIFCIAPALQLSYQNKYLAVVNLLLKRYGPTLNNYWIRTALCGHAEDYIGYIESNDPAPYLIQFRPQSQRPIQTENFEKSAVFNFTMRNN
jgi:hypothetical protein